MVRARVALLWIGEIGSVRRMGLLVSNQFLFGREWEALEIIGQTGDFLMDSRGAKFGGVELIAREEFTEEGA